MSDSATEAGFAAKLYRLALILTGDEALAQDACMETLAEARRRPDVFSEPGRSKGLFITVLRKAALRLKPAAPGEPPAGETPPVAAGGAAPGQVLRVLHGLPEPSRSAAALFHLGLLDHEGIQHLLDLDLQELADALQLSRAAMASAGAPTGGSGPASP